MSKKRKVQRNGASKRSRAQSFGPRASAMPRTGGLMGLEKKYIDYEYSGAMSNTWAVHEDGTADAISATAEGNGPSNRDGRRYAIHGVNIRGSFVQASAEAETDPVGDNVVRLAVVLDRQTNGAQLSPAGQVYDTNGTAPQAYALRSLEHTRRYRVLKDLKKRIPGAQALMAQGAVNTFARGEVIIPFSIDLTFKKPIIVECSGTTAAIASIVDNSIHVIATEHKGYGVTLSYKSRVRFTG